jgi:ABC-type transporter Mla MlaB component
MLRITRQLERTFRLEGRLTRQEVAVLREAFRSPDGSTSVLDLSSLAFVDEAGAAALADLRREGHELRGGSPFVRQILEEVCP